MPIISKRFNVIILACLIFCIYPAATSAAEGAAAMSMTITSTAFGHLAGIPKRFTCDSDNVSPALSWSDIPQHAKSLVLIVDDPDAPTPLAPVMTWVHWLLYNMPVAVTGLPENVAPGALPEGTLQGKNDWKQTGYRGPCPPMGKHRYFFKLYALDSALLDLHAPDKAQLEQAMAGHIIAHAELIGTYKRD